MAKATIYVETSVISYLVARPSRDLIVAAHQRLTSEWWDNQRHQYDLYISQIVLDEARAGDKLEAAKRLAAVQDLSLLEINEAVIRLAREPCPITRCSEEGGAGCAPYCYSLRQ